MQTINTLGNAIDLKWRHANFTESAFSAIAAAALAEFEPGKSFLNDVIDWVLQDHSLPRQVDIDAVFGQPPICLYINPMQTFFIQALVWFEATTAVHQHSFWGAFKVCDGESLHSQFAFTPRDVINTRLIFGEIVHRSSELLSLGDVRRIEQGDGFIHSVFHLAHPSVTLVVRTFSDGARTPQYQYIRPWLAVDNLYKSERLQRNLQVLTALERISRPAYVRRIQSLISESDLYTTFRYAKHFQEHRPSDEERTGLRNTVQNAHGQRGAMMLDSIDQAGRDDFLIETRKRIENPDHRLFIALLLVVPHRRAILEIMRHHYKQDAFFLLAQWVDELCAGTDAPLVALDESTRLVIKLLIQDPSLDALLRRLRSELPPDVVESQDLALRRLYDKLRTTSYFWPLFQS